MRPDIYYTKEVTCKWRVFFFMVECLRQMFHWSVKSTATIHTSWKYTLHFQDRLVFNMDHSEMLRVFTALHGMQTRNADAV